MQLYLVERTDHWSYDDYDKFVCWANSPEEAKLIHPSNQNGYKDYLWKEDGWHMIYSDGSVDEKPHTSNSWVDKLEDIKIWELSRAPAEPTIVLASYNAG